MGPKNGSHMRIQSGDDFHLTGNDDGLLTRDKMREYQETILREYYSTPFGKCMDRVLETVEAEKMENESKNRRNFIN